MTENRASGGYRVFSLLDREGPEPAPGQFYMLAAECHWEERGQRPFLPRALSVADTAAGGAGVRLDFLIEGIGPGTDRLCELEAGERVWVNGPLGNAFSEPRESGSECRRRDPGRRRHRHRPAGPAAPPLRRAQHPHPRPARLPRRGPLGRPRRLFSCCEVRLASEDGHTGHQGYVTDLLAVMLDGDDAATAVVYACGPPPMLEAVRSTLRRARRPLRAGDGVPDGLRLRRLLRLRGAEARRRLHAALRRRAGGAGRGAC